MCVIFFYANSNPAPGGYKLILASNRDEFYARNTRTASKWTNAEHVYGGIDLEPGREGGTWLAIGGHRGVFKVGALLNLTGEPRPRNALEPNPILYNSIDIGKGTENIKISSNNYNNNEDLTTPATILNEQIISRKDFSAKTTTHNSLLGRGMIVSDFVVSGKDVSLEDYNRQLMQGCEKYSAFNFVGIEIGAGDAAAHISVLSNAPAGVEQFSEGKCYGFGNSLPAVPFEKVQHGQQQFEKIVKSALEENHNGGTHTNGREDLKLNLLNLLKDRKRFWPDAELQRRAPNWGERLSSLNVYMPEEGYGSRTHTVILVDAEDKMHFHEETMMELDPEGQWNKTHIEHHYFQGERREN